MSVQSSNTGRWNVETNASATGEVVGVVAVGLQNAQFTAAGFAAALSQINTYYASNASNVFAGPGQPPSVILSRSGVTYSVLPGDQASQATSLLALLNTAADVTA